MTYSKDFPFTIYSSFLTDDDNPKFKEVFGDRWQMSHTMMYDIKTSEFITEYYFKFEKDAMLFMLMVTDCEFVDGTT